MKREKRLLIHWFFVALLSLTCALWGVKPGVAETLNEALSAAYKNSDTLQQKKALLEAGNEDYSAAVNALMPVIGYSLAQSYTDPPNFGQANSRLQGAVSARWKLYDFGIAETNKASVAATISSAYHRFLADEQSVLLNAARAYFGYWSAVENVALAENNVIVISTLLDSTRERFLLGNLTQTDVAQAEARLANARAGLSSARGTQAVSEQSYFLAIGHAPKGKKFKKPPLRALAFKNANAVSEQATSVHPSITAQKFLVKARSLALEGANIALRPSLDLSTSVSRASGANAKTQGTVSLTLSGTISSGGAIPSAQRRANKLYNAEIAALRAVVKTIERNAKNAWSNLEVARQQQKAAIEAVKASEIAYAGVKKEFTVGARTTLDVLNAEQELLNARVGLVRANTEFFTSYHALLDASGLLTRKEIGLNVDDYVSEEQFSAIIGQNFNRLTN